MKILGFSAKFMLFIHMLFTNHKLFFIAFGHFAFISNASNGILKNTAFYSKTLEIAVKWLWSNKQP